MLQQEDQRILGYFIEESKDHLSTIEQGLVNLPETLADSESINALFRAAHSVKGGAAMLGLDSIQQTAHRMEDYFKILKESPAITIDQKLESLLLRVYDTLQALVTHLESSLSISPDVAHSLMSQVEPVFAALNQHLQALAGGAGSNAPTPANALPVFQNQVPQKLREMLQLFKQPETPQTRHQLQQCCQQLFQLGEQFKIPAWCSLCETAAGAIAVSGNTYRTLAPVIIKELKQSQELVLAGRHAEISTTNQLQALSANNPGYHNN